MKKKMRDESGTKEKKKKIFSIDQFLNYFVEDCQGLSIEESKFHPNLMSYNILYNILLFIN